MPPKTTPPRARRSARAKLPKAPTAKLPAQQAAFSRLSTDGGPLVLLPAALRTRWAGSFVAGDEGDFVIDTEAGPFAFRTDYDFANPTSDYERACAVEGLVGLIDVHGAPALVLADEPLDTTVKPLPDGVLFARIHTAELGANLEAEWQTLPAEAAWSDEGLVLPAGPYVLMDALDHGEAPQWSPVEVSLVGAPHHVSSALVSTGAVQWVCLRLSKTKRSR